MRQRGLPEVEIPCNLRGGRRPMLEYGRRTFALRYDRAIAPRDCAHEHEHEQDDQQESQDA
jgi:hypothetical protein